ncbi:trimeric intracellular cation channel family protein [Thiomicrolovo sp. ZZH C-3]
MDFFILADIIGIVAFALSGFLAGVRHRLDLLGLIIVASLTALGGGVIRDLMLDRTPFAFTHYYPAVTVIASVVLALALRLYRRDALERKWLFIISDTVGLVAFSITGALLGIAAEFNFFGVIIVSFLTAIGGGVTRDVLVNTVPAILTSDFYGTIAVIVAVLLILLDAVGWLNDTAVLAVALFATVLRLVAHYRGWHLPHLDLPPR